MAGEPSIRDNNAVPSLIAVDPSITESQDPNDRGGSIKRLHVLKDPQTVSGQAYNPLMVYDVSPDSSSLSQFDDGDAIDTDSQGTLILGSTGVPGTAHVIHVDASGDLQVDVLTMPTVTIQDGGNVITVDGTVAATQGTSPWVVSGTVAATLSEPISVDDNGGSLTVDDGGLTLSIDDGGGIITVDGTVTIQDGGNVITVDATNLDIRDLTSASDSVTAVIAEPLEIEGDAAHDAAVSGNPVFIGYRSSEAIPTRVSADGDMVQSWGDRAGRLLVLRGSPSVLSATFHSFDPSGGASVTVINAPGANTAIFLLSMHLGNEAGGCRVILNSRSAVPVNTPFFNGVLGTSGSNSINYQWQAWEQLTTNQALAVTGVVFAGGLTAPNLCGYFEYFTAAV